MKGAKEVKCSEFGDAVIDWMDRKPAAKKVSPAAKKPIVKKVARKPVAKVKVKKKRK
jgi:hypothetical protein